MIHLTILYLVLGMSAFTFLYLVLGTSAFTIMLLSLVDTSLFLDFSIDVFCPWSLLQAYLVAKSTTWGDKQLSVMNWGKTQSLSQWLAQLAQEPCNQLQRLFAETMKVVAEIWQWWKPKSNRETRLVFVTPQGREDRLQEWEHDLQGWDDQLQKHEDGLRGWDHELHQRDDNLRELEIALREWEDGLRETLDKLREQADGLREGEERDHVGDCEEQKTALGDVSGGLTRPSRIPIAQSKRAS